MEVTKNIILITSVLASGAITTNAAVATWDTAKSGFYLDGEEVVANGVFKIQLDFNFDKTLFDTAESGLVLFQITSTTGDIVKWASSGANFSGNKSVYTANDYTVTSAGHYTANRLNGSDQIVFNFYKNTSMGIEVTTKFITNSGNASATETEKWSNKFSFLADPIKWSAVTLDDSITNCTISLIADDMIVIPEPSAFGLLAGAGALALVAARRRRTKKA